MKKKILPLLLIGFLSACAPAQEHQRPEITLPTHWHGQGETETAPEITTTWWRSFNSADLNTLITEALEKNHDLRAGLQQVAQARATAKIAGADLWPSADFSGGASKTRTNPASGKTSYSSSLSTGLDVSYEIDLFGKNRAALEGAKASAQASQYDQDALELVVMADVANGYFSVLNLCERLNIADENLKNTKEVLRIIRIRVREGMDSNLELAQQENVVATREAARASIMQQLRNAENALNVLLARIPGDSAITGTGLDAIAIPTLTANMPAALLTRRPDIAAAEARLISANADIAIARSAFFPSLSLGGSGTLSRASLGDPTAAVLALASSLSLPLFQGGRLKGGLERATARQKELVENYYSVVLNALQEVEDAFVAVKTADLREESLRTGMQQAGKAYNLALKKYEAGAIDFQTLLDTQSSKLSADDSFAQAKLAQLNAVVSLFKVLGGGWKID